MKEIIEVEIPLVRKRRRLIRAREMMSANGARQWEEKIVVGGGAVAPEGSRSGDGGEEGQATLPLVVILFEQCTEGE